MRPQLTFWSIQISIWGSLALLNLMARDYFDHYRFGELVNSLSLSVSLLTASGFLRRFYRDLKNDSLPKGIGQAVLGSVIATTIATVIVGVILLPNQQVLFGEVSDRAVVQLLASFPVIFTILLCWSAVYLLIKRQKALKLAVIREKKLQQELADSRMDLLLNQLNPHFMFNAINNIRAQILEDSEKARESLAQLSSVLRVTLQTKQDKLWSLPQEIELTKGFIKLNKLQFEHRLDVNWQLDGALDNFQVPCLSLQLLVENAIKHGIGNNSSGGVITIAIEANTQLRIRVTNPGKIQSSSDSTRLGITNIKQRLHLLFADKAHFNLFEQGDTVTAQIVLENAPCIAP